MVLKMHIWEHNPGRNYQGVTDDPFKYFSLIADNSDVETLRALPEFEILQKQNSMELIQNNCLRENVKLHVLY